MGVLAGDHIRAEIHVQEVCEIGERCAVSLQAEEAGSLSGSVWVKPNETDRDGGEFCRSIGHFEIFAPIVVGQFIKGFPAKVERSDGFFFAYHDSDLFG